jgi:hypothetical protein
MVKVMVMMVLVVAQGPWRSVAERWTFSRMQVTRLQLRIPDTCLNDPTSEKPSSAALPLLDGH